MWHMLRIILLLLAVVANACAVNTVQAEDPEEIVERNIGKLILLHDSLFRYDQDDNPFGVAKAFVLFKEQYKSEIEHLPVRHRLDYFWSSMWHLNLDGGYMTEFQDIVYEDCGQEFIKKLKNYVQKEKELNRSKRRLFLSEKVLGSMLKISERKIYQKK